MIMRKHGVLEAVKVVSELFVPEVATAEPESSVGEEGGEHTQDVAEAARGIKIDTKLASAASLATCSWFSTAGGQSLYNGALLP